MGVGGLLIVFGTLAQLTGVGVTLAGAVRTWREFAGGERIFDPVRSRTGRALAAADRVLRQVTRRPRPLDARSGATTTDVGLSATSTVRKQFRRLPKDLEPSEAFAELDDRTLELMTRLYDVRDRSEAQQGELRNELRRLAAQLGQQTSELRQDHRRIATGGIRLVLLGLAMTALGILAVGTGAFLPLW